MIKIYISTLLAILITGTQAIGVQEASELLGQGVKLYDAGDYNQAEAVFEAVLREDPYNRDAMKYLIKTARKINISADKMLDTSRAQALSEIEAAWNNAPLAREVAVEKEIVTAPTAEDIAIEKMTARLQELVIDKLDLDGVNIKDAVFLLNHKSRRIDPTGKGVKFLLLGAASPMANECIITVSLGDMNLYEALEYIVELSAFKFDVRDNTVAIMPIGYMPPAELKLVSFSVLPEVGEELAAAAGGGSSGADDLFGDAPDEGENGPMRVEEFFSIVGWPEGASAVYEPNFRKLFVKNTGQNIEAIEVILANLEDKALLQRSQQVEIEAKFVEFSEGVLEELGFDWNVYGSKINSELEMKGPSHYRYRDDWVSSEISSTRTDGKKIWTRTRAGYVPLEDPSGRDRTGQNLFGGYQRNNLTALVASELQGGILSQLGGVPASMLFSGKNFDLEISALEQAGSADVLSAPRITAKSGEEALIKVGESHRYPRDWQVDTGQRTTPAITPQDWEEAYLGVVLRVTPTVDPESEMIDLDLQPDIKELGKFDLYVPTSTTVDLGGNNSADLAPGPDLIISMPSYNSRSVQTTVTIADGHTVVMGGMVDERTDTFRDQVPILGDIPYLGRFFRTEGTRTSKKNLTIFVKATIVDEQGLNRKQRAAFRQMTTN